MTHDGAVVLAYFGDGATEEGAVHEALSFASLHKLPIIFVCENNGLSTHTLIQDRQPDRPIVDIATAHAVKAMRVDGMNVQEVSRTAQEAVAIVRGGGGPILIESHLPIRWTRWSRSELNMGYAINRILMDGLTQLLWRLHASHPIRDWDAYARAMEIEIAREVDAAFSFARSSPFPDADELTCDTYPRET